MPGDRASMWQAICDGGRRPFLLSPHGDHNYAALADAIRRWLALFDQAGMAAGDLVVIRTSNEFAAISCFMAALLDGKVPVNLATDTPQARLEAIIAAVEPRCMVHDGDRPVSGLPAPLFQFSTSAAAQPAAKPGVLARLTGRAMSAAAGLPPSPAAREPALPDDSASLAYLLFTSGTTAEPSGVQITSGNMFTNLATLTRLFGYDRHSRIFNDMILAHADGIIQGPIMAAWNGGTVIRAGGFSLTGMEQWLAQVRARRATHFITVPTIWAMVDAYGAHDDYFDAPELVSLQSVAAKLPEDLWERLEQRFGHPIANHYGLTETVASALYAGPHAEMGPRGTIGKPVDCEARIDPASGSEGELQLRGDNIFPGYWRHEARTAASFTADGWLKTGDLARRNEDGSYAMIGRIKNIIMSGGFLIRPEEIDEVMLRHAAVRECVSVALDDATFGEIAASVVVVEGDVSIEQLFDHARRHLEAQKVPRRISIASSIPRGISGKPQLSAIRQQLQAEAGPDQAETGLQPSLQPDLEKAVIAMASDVFRQPAQTLTLRSGPDQVGGWDSFSQLSLILEAEKQYGITIPAARIAGIETLGDLHRAISELAG